MQTPAGDEQETGEQPEITPADTRPVSCRAFVPGWRVCPAEGPCCAHSMPCAPASCRRGWSGPRAAPASCMQKVLKEELQPTGRLRCEVGTQPLSPDQAQWGALIGQPHACAPQLQTAQCFPASTPFLLPGAPSPHLPALWWDLSFHPLLPTCGGLNCIPPQTTCWSLTPPPGTCTWDLTQTEGLGRGNQVTMRSNWIMVALNPMTGGLVRGTFRHRHSGDDGAVSRQAETGVLSGHKPRHVEGGQPPSAAGRHREGCPLASTLTFDFRPPDSERTSFCWVPTPGLWRCATAAFSGSRLPGRARGPHLRRSVAWPGRLRQGGRVLDWPGP